MITYLGITAIVLAVFVAMSVLPLTPGRSAKAFRKVPASEIFYDDSVDLPGFFEGAGVQGTDADEMPSGYGEFGYEATNPIPVHTVYGNAAYLDRLWTSRGIQVEYLRLGSTRAQNIDGLIDKYEIKVGGAPVATLFICPYNRKNSERAPRGFQLDPFSWD